MTSLETFVLPQVTRRCPAYGLFATRTGKGSRRRTTPGLAPHVLVQPASAGGAPRLSAPLPLASFSYFRV